ncbi:MAG TPA: hypothetical protein VJB57_17830 [Dehalococcoidia bacterium]|nr:hypothetical protein [Dehalococcoidia bacterium]
MILLNPEGSSEETHLPLARRPESLDGKTIGVLGNSKLNADAVLLAVGQLLQERYGAGPLMHRFKQNFSRPAPNEIVEELATACDVVLTGVGD